MVDLRVVLKDMFKQRVVQGVTAFFAIAGLLAWLLGYAMGEYLAAASIILFAVATLRWIDDEEHIEKGDCEPDDNTARQ
jgi:dolichol kinase